MMLSGVQIGRKYKLTNICAFYGGSVSGFSVLDNEYIGFPDFYEI